jgi:(1->4)-alpha-D-glucan 1-alpha-D-glucosylmutase
MVNTLAQTLLKITAPGVPDFYQGTEIWDFSLVDPDNRRPVDFSARVALLADLRDRIANGHLAALARDLVSHWEDGGIKLYTIHRALECRRQTPDLFHNGDYVPLRTGGTSGERVVAFARRGPAGAVLTVVPRLVAPVTDAGARLPLGPVTWTDTVVFLPSVLSDAPYVNLFTGSEIRTLTSESGPTFLVADVLKDFPVGLLWWKAPSVPGAERR